MVRPLLLQTSVPAGEYQLSNGAGVPVYATFESNAVLHSLPAGPVDVMVVGGRGDRLQITSPFAGWIALESARVHSPPPSPAKGEQNKRGENKDNGRTTSAGGGNEAEEGARKRR